MPRLASQPTTVRIVRALLLLGGAGLIVVALSYNEWLLELIDPSPPLRDDTVRAVRRTQLGFVLVALALAAASAVAAPLLRKARDTVALTAARCVTFALILLPLFVAEAALRPFTPLSRPMTTIFQRDEALGWRMRPGAEGRWGDVRVRVNANGLRGAAIPHAKPANERRVLFLGDSVTFGYRLPDAALAYPERAVSHLNARGGDTVVAINAGVGGYSPWQELRYLESEGLRYAPDVVVVGFVLNDVTEKFGLRRFGGRGEGFQLEHTTLGVLDRLSVNSALFYQLRALRARLLFGSDVRAGAIERETLDVQALIRTPDDGEVQRAWNLTLQPLRSIAALCDRHGIPVLLAVFPYRVQLADPPGAGAPQRRMKAFAGDEGIPLLDLLPEFAARQDEADTPLFLDRNHLSPRGAEIAGEAVARAIDERGWLASPSAR